MANELTLDKLRELVQLSREEKLGFLVNRFNTVAELEEAIEPFVNEELFQSHDFQEMIAEAKKNIHRMREQEGHAGGVIFLDDQTAESMNKIVEADFDDDDADAFAIFATEELGMTAESYEQFLEESLCSLSEEEKEKGAELLAALKKLEAETNNTPPSPTPMGRKV